jgi:aminopeptidase N
MKAIIIIVMAFQSVLSLSQEIFNQEHNYLFNTSRILQKDNSPSSHSFDALKYRLNFDLYGCFKSPFPTSYKGSSVLIFRAESSIGTIELNAVSAALIVDSVRYSGISFFQQNDILHINLNRIHNAEETDSVLIYFRRNDISDLSLRNYSNQGWAFFTFLQPEGARLIYPCWDKQDDKALFDFTAKVPSDVMLGSNGLLKDTIRTGDSLFVYWESKDQMSTYLFTMIGQINYQLSTYYYHKLNNPNDSIPIMLFHNSGNPPSSNFVTSLKQMTDLFSEKFTPYPFEKIGFANIWPVTAGMMENQTLTTIWGPWSPNPHEHGHQWFGDYITCKTWADMWLNEGFATFLGAFYDEFTYGTYKYYMDIRTSSNMYFQFNRGFPIYNPSWVNHTPSIDSLFDQGIIYNKAACVIHTFRKTIGDTLFMQFIKAYMNDTNFTFKTVSTSDFVQKVDSFLGYRFNWFFDEWLNQPNHPVYQNTMNIADSGSAGWKLYFTISQVQTNSGFYRMPVKLKINYSDNTDSFAVVQNTYNNQAFTFTSARQPVGTEFDYDFSIVPKQANGVIGVNNNSKDVPKYYYLYQNYPNPFNSSTFITYALPVTSNVTIKIYDITGRLIANPVNANQQAGEHKISLDANNFASGVYFYRLEAGDYVNVKKMVLVK